MTWQEWKELRGSSTVYLFPREPWSPYILIYDDLFQRFDYEYIDYGGR